MNTHAQALQNIDDKARSLAEQARELAKLTLAEEHLIEAHADEVPAFTDVHEILGRIHSYASDEAKIVLKELPAEDRTKMKEALKSKVIADSIHLARLQVLLHDANEMLDRDTRKLVGKTSFSNALDEAYEKSQKFLEFLQQQKD